MASMNNYRRGVRATAGIAIIAFSIFPLFRNPGQPSKGLQSILEIDRAGFNATDHDIFVPWPQLLPRQQPPGITLSLHAAKCRGEANLAQLNGPGNQKAADTSVDELEGWRQEITPLITPEELDLQPTNHLFQDSKNDLFFVTAMQYSQYHDVHGVPREPTNGIYSLAMSPKDDFILAVYSYSPLHNLRTERQFAALRGQLNDEQLMDAVPAVSFWSDITWTSWLSLCKQVNRKPNELQFVMHDTVITQNTKYIMEQVFDPETPRGGLNAPWPGKDFYITTDAGKALLGTVHGTGTSRLLYDHRQDIPKKGIQKVTAFTGDIVNAYGRDYYLIFTLNRGKAIE